MIDQSIRQIADMDCSSRECEVIRSATSRSPSSHRIDKTVSSELRKRSELHGAERDVDDPATSTLRSAVSYSRSSRPERSSTVYQRSSDDRRYTDHCSDSKYRSARSMYARRSPPDSSDYRDGNDCDDYHRPGRSRHTADLHSYYSSSYHEPTSSYQSSSHYDYRSDHYRDRHRRSPSESRKSRTYRDDEYSRHNDRDDFRRTSDVKNNSSYCKSSPAFEKGFSDSYRSSAMSSGSRLKTDDCRSSNHLHYPAATSPRNAISSRTSVTRKSYHDWEKHVSSSNRTYYYNKVSGVSQWDPPQEWEEHRSSNSRNARDYRISDPKSRSPKNVYNHASDSEDSEGDGRVDRKRCKRSAAVDVRHDMESHHKPQSSSHYNHSHDDSNNRGSNSVHRSSASNRLTAASRDGHSRSHSLRRDRSHSVQSSSGDSLTREHGFKRLLEDETDRYRDKRERHVGRREDHVFATDHCRKRKDRRDCTPDTDRRVLSENGITNRKGGSVDEKNCIERKRVILDSPPTNHHHSDHIVTEKRTESDSSAALSDQNSNSSCRSQCLSPSQVTMDNLEKIIDSLADTPGLPDLRKLSREDALKTIQQVLRIMKEASLGIGSRTPTKTSSPVGSASLNAINIKNRPPALRNSLSNSLVDHEPAINGGAVFLNRQDLTIPSPSSEISGYSSTRSPSDSGVDIAVPSKPPVPSLTATLASCFREDLIRHVQNWSADQAERQANKFAEEAHNLGSRDCTRVSAELKMARSLVRLTEIQATLQEQRILFVRQQIKEVEAWKSQHNVIENSNSM